MRGVVGGRGGSRFWGGCCKYSGVRYVAMCYILLVGWTIGTEIRG